MPARPDPLDALTPRPTPRALSAAREALLRAGRHPLPEVGPYLAGGVQLEWRGPEAEVRLLVHPDGVVEYLAYGQWRRPADAAGALLAAVLGHP